MGSAWLAQRTGASIVNGNHELFGHGDMRLNDGESFGFGKLTFKALHTPGHTPESMCYVLYDEGSGDADSAYCIFSGDTLFYGDTGRTDLPDRDKSVENAGVLYDSVHSKLAGLADSALILPAHGPGSVCGSGMAERPYSTLGEEKRYNQVFVLEREAFARQKGGENIPRPPFFRHMEKVNLNGGLAPVVRPGDVRLLDVDAFRKGRADALVFDTRQPEGFAAGHIKDSYSIWLGGLPVFGGWVADESTPIYLLGDREEDIDQAVLHLTRIGLDNIQAGLAGGFGSWRNSGQPLTHAGVITAQELNAERDTFQVLDVREADEFASGHIAGAQHCYVGYLENELSKLDLDATRPVVVTCGVGHRAGLGVSILLRNGYRDVRNLLGGMSAWQALKLPTEQKAGAE